MQKVQSISISQFMVTGFPKEPTVIDRVVDHLERNQSIYIQISGAVITCCLMGAADPSVVTGAAGIDVKAHHIYHKLCMIGKWIIVVKGGIDIIGAMMQGDMDLMKKKIIGYVIGYVALLGLPWILDQTNSFFSDLGTEV